MRVILGGGRTVISGRVNDHASFLGLAVRRLIGTRCLRGSGDSGGFISQCMTSSSSDAAVVVRRKSIDDDDDDEDSPPVTTAAPANAGS